MERYRKFVLYLDKSPLWLRSNSEETTEVVKALVRDDGVAMAWKHRLFRDILDRHKVTLTEEAKDQIHEAQVSNVCYIMSNNLFH